MERPLAGHDLKPGARVKVLPGRSFPAFRADDVGVVTRVDMEARTCDVVFREHGEGVSVPVAMRHLTVVAPAPATVGGSGTALSYAPGIPQAERLSSSFQGRSHSVPRSGGDTLHYRDQNSWSTTTNPAIPHRSRSPRAASPPPSPRSSSIIRSSLRTTKQAECSLVSSMDHSTDMPHTMSNRVAALEAHTSAQQNAIKTLEEHMSASDMERRAASLQEASLRIQHNLEVISNGLEGQERRAVSLEDVVGAAGLGLGRLGELLESQERRTAALGQSISMAHESVSRLGSSTEAEAHRLTELERRHHALARHHNSAEHDRGGRQDDPMWQALRELQELVVHESEHRAAGLREAIGMLSQGMEQLRTEQARHSSDIESQLRSEAQRSSQHLEEIQVRQDEQDKRAELLMQRFDVLNQMINAEHEARAEAIALVEAQVRGACSAAERAQAEARSVVEHAEADARIAAERAESEARIAAELAEAEGRSAADRAEAEKCSAAERAEANQRSMMLMETSPAKEEHHDGLSCFNVQTEPMPSTSSIVGSCVPAKDVSVTSHLSTTMTTSQSLSRLDALEARLERSNASSLTTEAPAQSPLCRERPELHLAAMSTTEDTLGRLRGQLDGLRSELAASSAAEVAAPSAMGMARCISPSCSVGTFAQGFGQAPLSPVRTIHSPSPVPHVADVAVTPIGACRVPSPEGQLGSIAVVCDCGKPICSIAAASDAVSSTEGVSMNLVQEMSLVRVEGAAGEAQSRLAEAFRAAGVAQQEAAIPREQVPSIGSGGALMSSGSCLAGSRSTPHLIRTGSAKVVAEERVNAGQAHFGRVQANLREHSLQAEPSSA